MTTHNATGGAVSGEPMANALLDLVLIPRQSAPAAGTGEGAA